MPTALVTGASRGIGKQIALYLARAGYDVAVTARTMQDGELMERSQKTNQSNVSAQPGSLTSTTEEIEAEGVRALAVPADLTIRSSGIEATEVVLEQWGGIDVLVNNATYRGPGTRDVFEDTEMESFDLHFEASVMAPLAMTKHLLPHWLERGSGTLINVVSSAGYEDPPALVGEGGWCLGYGMTKGALIRMAGVLAVELGDRGLRFYSLQPGPIATERSGLEGKTDPHVDTRAPAAICGAVAAWLVTDPRAAEPNGRIIEAQDVCRELGLYPGWP